MLTLGSNLVINDNDDLGYNDTLSSNGYVQTGDGIINKGKINVTGGSGGYLTINSDTFTNQGTITVTNGSTLNINPGDSLRNAQPEGRSHGLGQRLDTGFWEPRANLDRCRHHPGRGAAVFWELFEFNDGPMHDITTNGTVYIDGTLTNTGATLNVGPAG